MKYTCSKAILWVHTKVPRLVGQLAVMLSVKKFADI